MFSYVVVLVVVLGDTNLKLDINKHVPADYVERFLAGRVHISLPECV